MCGSGWHSAPAEMRLAPHSVHVWRARLDDSASRLRLLMSSLSIDERERAGRFKFERDSNRFVAARGILRAILSRYLFVDPANLKFSYGPRGKPALEAQTTRPSPSKLAARKML